MKPFGWTIFGLLIKGPPWWLIPGLLALGFVIAGIELWLDRP